MGRETCRTDSRDVAFVTNYDYLGRVTSVSASKTGSNTETISYTYGGPGDGTAQMRLKSKSLNGWVKEYGYDAHGRVTSETMGKANVISRSKEYTYGSSGLLATETLPGNKVYSYTYDAYGNLTGVSGAGGAVVWSLVGNTGRRTVSHTVLGGNTSYPFVKTRLLDQYGYLDSIRTVHHGDWWYQDDDYNYSPLTGNLTSMRQQWMDCPRTFTYDNLDRLTAVYENNQAIMSMTYASNGNIQSKTGLGQYTYSTSRPHAVQTVENTGGEIELGEQDITYNLWGKASTVWCYDDDSFYYYTAEYGPDLERVWTTLVRSYHTEYEKFQWGDYEEKRTDGVTPRFYFVDGGDGLAGLHTERDAQGGAVTHTAATMTDHLGSLMSMADNSDWCFDAHYDPWGHREVSYPYLYSIERGFTGHEQLDGLRLIDMGGRMYDPQLARFLSPDNFVQAPGDPQNYNRYSYCLNNPLKYTDPSGESIVGAIIFGAIIGTYSGGVLANEGNFDPTMWDWQSGRTWGYMAGGMITGALSGAAGAAIASSGIPMANTLSIMGGSLTNSLGTYAYTGGQTDISMSFGFCSYNFTKNTLGAIWDKNNTTLDYICYSLGLLANISDFLVGKKPGDVSLRTENDPNNHKIQAVYDGDGNIIGYEDAPFKDLIGHSQIVDMDGKTLVDWGPSNEGSWLPGTNSYEGGPIPATKMKWGPVTIKGANVNRISNWNPSGRYNLLFNNCVQQASRALNAAGVFNVGIHPYLLHAQMYLRSVGVRPFLFSYYGIK